MNSQNYSWGTLYETLATCEGDHEDKSLQKIFSLFHRLDSATTLNEIKTLLKETPLTDYEKNRVNSACYDGLLVSAFKKHPLYTLIRIYPEYLDTCKFYLSKKILEETSLLYRACEYRREKIVNILLDYKICIDNLFFTAVEPAVLQGYLPIIQILMERGLINKDNIVTFFRISCDHNKVDVVKYLLSYSAENSKSISEGFAYRLRHGCALNIDLLRIFVDHKLIAVTDEFLAGTIVSEQYDLAEFLIDKGANPRFNNNGILRHAMERCNTKTVRFLETIGVKMEELKDELHTYFDLWSGSESALEMLLKAGADPKRYTYRGERFPILFRYYYNTLTIIKLLLDFGADVNAIYRGEHVLECIVANWETETDTEKIKLLIERGAVVTEKMIDTIMATPNLDEEVEEIFQKELMRIQYFSSKIDYFLSVKDT